MQPEPETRCWGFALIIRVPEALAIRAADYVKSGRRHRTAGPRAARTGLARFTRRPYA